MNTETEVLIQGIIRLKLKQTKGGGSWEVEEHLNSVKYVRNSQKLPANW